MSTRKGPGELAADVGPAAREAAGKVRRMIVTRTNTARYQVIGHQLIGGELETRDADVFQGVGFYARPASSGGDVEAVVAFSGGAGNPLIISIRQESVRRDVAGDLAADETQVHNSTTVIRIKADGTVEIRAASGGAPRALAFQEDLETLRDHVATLLVGGTGSAAVPAPSAGTGTSVLKAE